ncbi:homeobox KN domain-containing protein [Halteromyces radiatus]|uniref:homeobox KN domain-containing protein n=1 Tax=Halteromyces radiatus TaxID=101107 RepID=UPI00221FCC2D|nr:homeobox KN domain-containing protein [Halteromyces radiatus]KAI8080033.1 homeobox KN domain-containing protein [Halteromyces radiatus]
MLRFNGQLWTILLSSSSSSSSLDNRNIYQRQEGSHHHRHRSQDSFMSMVSSSGGSDGCRTPLEMDEYLPLGYPSPYDDDNNNEGDDKVSKISKGKMRKKKKVNHPPRNKKDKKRQQETPPSSPSTQEDESSILSSPLLAGRKRRGNLPKSITCLLKEWLVRHVDHPYPTDNEKSFLQQETQLTINQISNWFINARRRLLPYLVASPLHGYDMKKKQDRSGVPKTSKKMNMIKKRTSTFSHRPKRTCRQSPHSIQHDDDADDDDDDDAGPWID